MHYPLNKFTSIPESALQQFTTYKIYSADDLLNHAATPRLREALSQKTGIPVEDLIRWAGMADLVRIKGIGLVYAEWLIESGRVGNVQQFLNTLRVDPTKRETKRIAERETVKRAASDLAKQLADYREQRSISTRVPSSYALTEAVEEAAELRPRLILAAPDESEAFRQFIFSRYREGRQHSWKTSWTMIGIVVGVIAILFAIELFLQSNQINNTIVTNNEVLNFLSAQFLRVVTFYIDLNAAVILALLVITMIVVILIYDFLYHLLATRIVLWLFNSSPYRKFYQKATTLSLKSQKQANWWGTIVFALIALGLVLYYIFTLEQGKFGVEFIRSFSVPVAVGGMLLGFVVAMPHLRFYWREYKVDSAVDEAGMQRYLIYYLGHIALLPIMVVLLTKVALPTLFWGHGYIYHTLILPSFQTDILEWRMLIGRVKLDDEASQQRREIILDFFDETIIDNLAEIGPVVTESNSEMIDATIPLALNIVVWLALTAFTLLFMVPYLALGGWRRGIFYIGVLIAANELDKLLENNAPTWFSLEPGSISSPLIIFFVIFSNAIFFEWVFTFLTEQKKICPGCNTQLDEYDLHCSVCGLIQP